MVKNQTRRPLSEVSAALETARAVLIVREAEHSAACREVAREALPGIKSTTSCRAAREAVMEQRDVVAGLEALAVVAEYIELNGNICALEARRREAELTCANFKRDAAGSGVTVRNFDDAVFDIGRADRDIEILRPRRQALVDQHADLLAAEGVLQ